MNLYKIEKNIPMPISLSATIRKLEIGDSFLIPLRSVPAARYIAYKSRIYISVKKISENEGRLWRTR